jgi:glycosyltransferase involved in cell wall biosynthesis
LVRLRSGAISPTKQLEQGLVGAIGLPLLRTYGYFRFSQRFSLIDLRDLMDMAKTGTTEKFGENTVNATQGFNRFVPSLSPAEIQDFAEVMALNFGAAVSAEDVQHAHDRIAGFVHQMRGRVGEGMFDLLLLYFTRRIAAEAFIDQANTKDAPVLRSFEIGTLFGGSTVVSAMAIEGLPVRVRQVAIDPLSGYYGQGVDPVTGLPVVKENVIENFRIAKLPLSDIEILPGLSEDPEIIERATRGRFISGYIDGDHSYAGIHRDWFNYTPHIEVGGYVIVDNYNDKTAPEVSIFVDGIVLPYLREYYETVLETAQTIVFRKVLEVPDALNKQLAENIPFTAAVRNMDKLRGLAMAQQHSAEERGRALENRSNRVAALVASQEKLQSELRSTQEARDAATRLASVQEIKIARLNERSAGFERVEAAALSQIEAEREKSSQQLAEAAAALKSAEAERAALAADLEARDQELSSWQQKFQDSAREIDERSAALAAETARAEKAEFEAAQLAADMDKVKQAASATVAQAVDDGHSLKRQLDDIQVYAAETEIRVATTQRELKAAEAARIRAQAEVKALSTQLAKAKEAEAAVNRVREELLIQRKQASRQEGELHLLEAQLEAPRILLSRLVRATMARLRGKVPGLAGNSNRPAPQAASAKPAPLKSSKSKSAPGAPAPAGSGTEMVIPPTPEMHDAGPPQHDQTLFVNYTFGGKTRYLQRHDFLRQTLRAGRALDKLRGAFKGERCFVIGNGPSLNQQNLPQLESEFTIGSNYIYMNKEKMGFYPTIIAFANYLVIKQRMDEIMGLEEPIKALPFYLYDEIGESNNGIGAPKNSMVLNMQHQTPNFSDDASSYASTQSTVTYVNLQLAHYLGFDRVYLIGVDNRYIQPNHGKEGTVLTQEEDDPNHFTPNYFKGLKWQKGDEEKMESLYVRAKAAFEERGSKVIDCTHNGALTVFEKQDLDTVIRKSPPPPRQKITQAVSVMRKVTSPKPHDQLTPKRVIITISPDLDDRFGHHYNMDRYLRTIARENGDELISLCSVNLDPQMRDEHNWLMPAFEGRTWYSLRDEKVIRRKANKFTEDLKRAMAVVERAFEPDTQFSLYMYTGNLPLAKAVAAFAQDRPNYDVAVHHFYGAIMDMENSDIVEESRRLIGETLGMGARLFLGTDELVDYYEAKTGYRLGYLGDPSVTFSDDEVRAMMKAPAEPERDMSSVAAQVFFPPNMNIEKGYLTAVGAARRLVETERLDGQFSPVLRYVPRDNTPDHVVKEAQALKANAKARFVEGVLTDAQFQAVTRESDIIAIPYTRKAFDRRMSGSLTDALMTAKPIVATRGTYVGNQVERFGCGEVFDDGDADGLVAALERVRANYPAFKKAAIKARREYFRERSWGSLYTRVILNK